MPTKNELFRALPSVDKLTQTGELQELSAQYGHDSVVRVSRRVLEALRGGIQSGHITHINNSAIIVEIAQSLAEVFQPTLRPVINATGVIIHTNLGRAPLSKSAQEAIQSVAGHYNTLEFDLENGKRGSRLVHAEALLRDITGAESALVVNNNASATVLMLAGLALNREVIVSRGQLVEIGGGFRVPDVMRQSGARLVEVGTTNRTRVADYANAITEDTALLMRVHSSNFKQIGFTEETPFAEIADLAHQHDLGAVDDLGSGALVDTTQFGLAYEPMVQASLADGADVVAFSGDKLLGGPQAGILLGKAQFIDPLKKHPLARAIRADKLCLAALTATLDHYRRGEALDQIPVLRMMAMRYDELSQIAHEWRVQLIQHHDEDAITVTDGESTVGGGSLPGATLATALLRLQVSSPDDFMVELRKLDLPIIGRIADDAVVFDPRTVLIEQHTALTEGLTKILARSSI